MAACLQRNNWDVNSMIRLYGVLLVAFSFSFFLARHAPPTENWVMVNLDRQMHLIKPGVDKPSLISTTEVEYPVASHDGERIAFTQSGDEEGKSLMISDSSLENPREVVSLDFIWQATWSPDDQWLAFTGNADAMSGLFIVRTDGTDLRRLSWDETISSSKPHWSPDLHWIYYEARINFTEVILRVQTDGREPPQILAEQARSPSLSPNGRLLTYSTYSNFYQQIAVMDVDGYYSRIISTIQGGSPVWSPDGRWIMFTGNRNSDIYRMRPNGADLEAQVLLQGEPIVSAWNKECMLIHSIDLDQTLYQHCEDETVALAEDLSFTSLPVAVRPVGFSWEPFLIMGVGFTLSVVGWGWWRRKRRVPIYH
jgi:Tol biopolymer transport system component